MDIIKCKSKTLGVQWSRRLYTVSKETLHIADSRRRCWICHGHFAVGDGMTIANTDEGNKTIHTRCYKAQNKTVEPVPV